MPVFAKAVIYQVRAISASFGMRCDRRVAWRAGCLFHVFCALFGINLNVSHTARLKKRWKCLCGAQNCSGTLLKPKRQEASPAQAPPQRLCAGRAV